MIARHGQHRNPQQDVERGLKPEVLINIRTVADIHFLFRNLFGTRKYFTWEVNCHVNLELKFRSIYVIVLSISICLPYFEHKLTNID